MFWNQYPYINLNDLNLDYLLNKLKELELRLVDFIKINTIKYADPIQWNITTQYEANTVVIDGNTGTAYLSVQPVPSGIALTNTDYWTVIFTLDVISANQNITLRNDGSNILATFASNIDDWLLWNGYLYKVIRAITTNEAYVVGYNLQRYTVEMFISDYISNVISVFTTEIGDLNDLSTTDKSNLVAAINEVFTGLSNEIINRQNADNAINSTLQTIEDSIYYDVKLGGAVGDGVTDDTAALTAIMAAHKYVRFTAGNYKVVEVPLNSGNVILMDDDAKITYSNHAFLIDTIHDVSIKGNGSVLTFDTNTAHTEYQHAIAVLSSYNIYIENLNIKDCSGDGVYCGAMSGDPNSYDVFIDNVVIDGAYRNGISLCDCNDISVNACDIKNTSGTNPQFGVDIEPNTTGNAWNITITNCKFSGNVGGTYANATGAQRVIFANNVSTDLTSTYIDLNDSCVIDGCIFKSRIVIKTPPNTTGTNIFKNCIFYEAADGVTRGSQLAHYQFHNCSFIRANSAINRVIIMHDGDIVSGCTFDGCINNLFYMDGGIVKDCVVKNQRAQSPTYNAIAYIIGNGCDISGCKFISDGTNPMGRAVLVNGGGVKLLSNDFTSAGSNNITTSQVTSNGGNFNNDGSLF